MVISGDMMSGAKTGSKKNGAGRRMTHATVGALASMGILMGSVATTPALAQLAPDAPSVETPFGRAPLSFADIIEKVKPSVVSISVVAGGKSAKGSKGLPEGMPDIPEDSPFYEFFKNLPKEFRNMPQQQRPTQAQGSGFVISGDGYVVTNNHVVDGATKIQVSFDDQEKLDAELVGTDPRTDIALLKIKSSKTFPFVKFTDKPGRVGDWALAVGNPFGLGGTVTAGIISALGRDIGSGPYDFIQIDAAVNKGNSGGPTFNLSGEVIGVNTAIFSPSGGNVGIAFAVPARTALDVIAQLKKSGTVSRGWLGVKIQNVDEDTASAIGLTEPKGALVSEVTPNGPAAGSGLKVQDAILAVNADKISDSRDLARKIADYAPDTTVDVKVWRANKEETVKIRLGKFPGSADEIAKLEQGKTPDDLGNTALDQLGLTLAPAKSGSEGVAVMEVDPDSDAAEKGIKAGDVILEVGGSSVAGPSDVADGVKKASELGRKAVMLYIKSADQRRIVPIQLKKG
ncbi:Do family serine endopeptidase [Hyphomicrobium sp. LHD-15]|uniref:Do family serine endopeptidase n=1 Tax=Hyphomicrobium sp. LHD-15 TaxID=3072142 RepID=UPI0035BE258F